MYWTLHFIVTRLPDSLRSVRDHFLARCPTDLTVDLLEKEHLLAAEKSIVAVGAARGVPHTPIFEGCSPSPLAPSFATAAAFDFLGAESVGAASAPSGRRRSGKGKGAKGSGGGTGGGGVVVEAVEEEEEAGGVVAGVLEGVVASVAAVEAVAAEVAAAVAVGVEALALARDSSSSSVPVRLLHPSSFTCNKFHTQHRCFSRLDDAWREEMGEEVERPRWHELLRAGVDIFALDYDAILTERNYCPHAHILRPECALVAIVFKPAVLNIFLG
ncbi:unnamed protein product [Closterium sp. Yama58-4]|nr:unnamed protein product [Closterium sp. Yama58-4]